VEDASRVFWWKQSKESAGNDETLFVPPSLSLLASPSHEESFFEHYEAIRAWMNEPRRPGLAVVALDAAGIQAKAHLRAPSTGINSAGVNTAIVGRHGRCEIFLPDDPSLSLRHIAVLLTPDLRFRLVDLRTAGGFTDAQGTDLRALQADETFFIRCGKYTILFAPFDGKSAGWPETPEAIWGVLRERSASRYAHPRPSVPEDGLLSDGEEALGELIIASEEGTGTMAVGRQAATSGILLGRSDRCDGDFLLSDPHISRVHLLIVEIAGRLYAIDTASKNGVWARGGEHRVRQLESGTILSICGRATVEWRFFH